MPSKSVPKLTSKNRKDGKQSVKFVVEYGDKPFSEKSWLQMSRNKNQAPPIHNENINFPDLPYSKQKEEDYARERKERMKTQKEEVLFRPFDNTTKYILTRNPIEGSPKIVFHDKYSTVWGIDLVWPNE